MEDVALNHLDYTFEISNQDQEILNQPVIVLERNRRPVTPPLVINDEVNSPLRKVNRSRNVDAPITN